MTYTPYQPPRPRRQYKVHPAIIIGGVLGAAFVVLVIIGLIVGPPPKKTRSASSAHPPRVGTTSAASSATPSARAKPAPTQPKPSSTPSAAESLPGDHGHPLFKVHPHDRPGQAADTCATVTFTVSGGQIHVVGDLPGPMDLLVAPELANGDASDGNVVSTPSIKAGATTLDVTMPYTHPLDHVFVQATRNNTDLDVCWAYRA